MRSTSMERISVLSGLGLKDGAKRASGSKEGNDRFKQGAVVDANALDHPGSPQLIVPFKGSCIRGHHTSKREHKAPPASSCSEVGCQHCDQLGCLQTFHASPKQESPSLARQENTTLYCTLQWILKSCNATIRSSGTRHIMHITSAVLDSMTNAVRPSRHGSSG